MNYQMFKLEIQRKGRGAIDQIANIRWIIEIAREFQKNIYFYFIDYAKAFDCVDHNKLWKILKKMGIADHLIAELSKITQLTSDRVRVRMRVLTLSQCSFHFLGTFHLLSLHYYEL